jgi:hypothetical protein
MNERDKLIAKLIKEKGGSREDYLKLLNSIAYHESGHTMDPTTKQIGGGPGRGKYQFEAGKNAGGITAARRTVKYYKDNNIPVPTWLSSAASGDDLDATALSSEQQDILFLGNMREHPKANFSNVWEGKKSIKDFWLDNHWAGGAKERAKRSKSFDSSMESRKDNPKTQQSITSTREEGEFIPPFTKEEFRARENNPANIDKKKEFNLYDYKKVRESRKGPYPHIEGQEKGTTSSHLMSYSENDNGYEAFPTLFQDGKDWKQLPWREALDKARSEGESYNFRTEQGAKDFAGGEWKEKNEQPTTLPSDFMGNLSQYAKGGLISTDPPVYLASSNQKALGGSLPASAYIGEGNFYGGGDIHENMKNGGIRVGVGENGKYNTVEKDEFTFNFKDGKYAYSNRLSSGGLVTNDTNAYADGGLVTDPVKKGPTSAVPSLATPSFNPITSSIFNPPKSSTQQFTKTEMKPVGLGLKKVEEKFEVPDVRKQYTHGNVVAPGQEANVQFQQAVQDPSANEFLNRYNNDWSRQKLQEQAGLSNENIDNMILRGLSPKKVIGGNEPNSKASVDRDNNIINIGAQFNNEPGIETHERVHSSMFDAAQGDNLMNVLGNPFQQEGRSMLKGSSLGRETIGNLKKPHEAYGNFAEFREKLGLKPGEQLTEEELKKRVKAKKLSNENFYKVYNDKNITKALNTIAANAKRRGNNTRLT